MNLETFTEQMIRWHEALGIEAESSRFQKKIHHWFEALNSEHKPSEFQLIQWIHQAIRQGGIPSLHKLLSLRYERSGEKTPQNFSTPCDTCAGEGALHALKYQENLHYRFTFRCPHCENWRGKLGTAIPLWEDALSKQYQLEKVVPQYTSLYNSDEIGKEVMALLREHPVGGGSGQKILEAMLRLEVQYPSIGFQEEAQKLLSHLLRSESKQQNTQPQNLKEVPHENGNENRTPITA